jgi:hypothetical protein
VKNLQLMTSLLFYIFRADSTRHFSTFFHVLAVNCNVHEYLELVIVPRAEMNDSIVCTSKDGTKTC